MSIKAKKEYVSVIHSIIEQQEVIDYDVNYYRANYRRCEKVQEIDFIKYKAFLVKESSDYSINYEPNKCFELVNDQNSEFCEIIKEQKVECCELINDQKVECCELIEGQKVEFCKLIEDQKVEYCEAEITEHQKVEDINMLKSEDETMKLNLLKK